MKAPLRVLGLSLLSLGILSAAGAALAQDDDPLEHPLVQDATLYAARYDVELEEAVLRLELQPVIGKLQEKLARRERATFAGLFIQHEPSYLIVVQFTEGGGASLEKLLQRDEFYELYAYVEVRPAALSLEALAAVQADAHRTARARRVPIESSINVPENRVDLFTTEPNFLAAALEAVDAVRLKSKAAPLLDNVTIVNVERLSGPSRYVNAGRPLSTCTSGFAVQNAGGTRGVLTSGHCGSSQAFNQRNLPFQSELFTGSYDVQWHTAPDLHVVNRTWDGLFDTTTPYYRFITATRPRSQQVIGETVCKFGMTTGYTCGTISSTTFAPSYVPNAAATFVIVSSSTQDQSAPGDSGGPWFSGSTAYGVNSGEFTTNFNAIYMPIDYATGIGVSVLTTTPTLNLGRFTYRAMGDNITAYTEVNSNDYECGVAGFAALDADIQENNAGDIILTYLTKANSHFNFRGEFRTHNNHESWDFDLLCLKKSVYSVSRFEYKNKGDNVAFNTGLSTSTYECGLGGMAARDGDIQENDTGNILMSYMYRSGGQWWMRGEFRTHNNHESWDMDALCVNKSHPVVRYEFKNLGDNVNGYNTAISSSTYECGIAGMAALDGDIQENGSGNPIQAYIYSSGGTWRIRADFRTHNNNESWDVDLLCIQR